MAGWGALFGWLGNVLPGRAESLRNKKEKIENDIKKLHDKQTWTSADYSHYAKWIVELHKTNEALGNRTQ